VLLVGNPDRDQLYAAFGTAEQRLARPVQATIRDTDWLESGSGPSTTRSQATLAASYRALRDAYQQWEHILTQAAADRTEWEQATAHTRRLAITADAELRRRHPHQKIEPLRSAEPAPARDTVPTRAAASRPRQEPHRGGHLDSRPGRGASGVPR
jgi:hypothetical protein